MLLPLNSLLGILTLVVLLIIGVPVPLCFGVAAAVMIKGGNYGSSLALHHGHFVISSLVLLAVPLFILAGGLMAEGGLGRRLVSFTELFVGRVKGGLGAVGVISSALFGAVSGSAAAGLSCIGSIMLPELNKRGYPRGHSAALISCAAVLALLIPPSIDMVLFGWMSGQSIAACFLATVGPGILLMVNLCLLNWWMLRRSPIGVPEKMSINERVVELGRRARGAFFALLMPVIILGGIYGGVFTPTEAAAVSVIYVLPLAFLVYRALNLRKLVHVLVETATTSGVILVMLFFAMVLAQMLVRENFPEYLAGWLLGLSTNRYILLLLVNVFLIFIGMLMDDVCGITLTTPLLFPLMRGLGVHPLHFAAIVGTNLGMGLMTPPTAPLLYLGARVANVDVKEMLKPVLILVVFAMFPAVLVTTYWPTLSLWLPRVTGFMH